MHEFVNSLQISKAVGLISKELSCHQILTLNIALLHGLELNNISSIAVFI